MANRGNRNVRRPRRPGEDGLGYAGLWALAAVVVLVVMFFATRDAGVTHPEPRAGVAAASVVPASHYAGHPRTAQVYREAAQVPEILDGLYCYCRCKEHSGHYSLLDCFASDHAARCDICMSEAALASRMTREGRTLDRIRHAIDNLYGDGA